MQSFPDYRVHSSHVSPLQPTFVISLRVLALAGGRTEHEKESTEGYQGKQTSHVDVSEIHVMKVCGHKARSNDARTHLVNSSYCEIGRGFHWGSVQLGQIQQPTWIRVDRAKGIIIFTSCTSNLIGATAVPLMCFTVPAWLLSWSQASSQLSKRRAGLVNWWLNFPQASMCVFLFLSIVVKRKSVFWMGSFFWVTQDK